MSRAPRLVVFTDLDGTLLDHDSYAWDAAAPALAALRERAVPLVLVSSKTRAEIEALREALGNTDPYVVENGAVTFISDNLLADNLLAADLPAADAADATGERVLSAGPPRAALQAMLDDARDAGGYAFTSFAELGTDGIARHTGLDPARAAAANARTASEPLLWQDTPERLEAFAARLAGASLRCVRGGRFVHVMGRFDKGDAVAALADRYRAVYAPAPVVSVVLGDGPNDLGMLALADVAVVVKGRHDQPMPVAGAGRVLRTEAEGPAGWNAAVLQLLDEH